MAGREQHLIGKLCLANLPFGAAVKIFFLAFSYRIEYRVDQSSIMLEDKGKPNLNFFSVSLDKLLYICLDK